MRANRIKRYIIIITVAITQLIIALQLQSSPIPLSGSSLNKIFFVNNQIGYIIGNDGKMFKTIDGGTNWQPIIIIINNATITEHLTDIHFTTEQNGLVTAHNGNLYKTINGGATWSNPNIGGTTENINSITHLGNGQYLIAGNNSTVIRIQDEVGDWSTKFWYDHLGRIVASQNSKQHDYTPRAYSYTQYDALGRISQTGEIQPNVPLESGVYSNNKYNDIAYQLWVGLGTKTQVVKTFYDYAQYTIPNFTQEHLRNRVSSVIYQETYAEDNNQYNYASHYSYDIHGNVKTLMQDYTELAALNQQYKRIDYDYDLISGKVNQVHYQAKQPDQFSHQYEYDADNRITHVYTSRHANPIAGGSQAVGGVQGVACGLWDQEAKYYYYDHGPLARVEIGQHKVQAIDYAYTLQGWLKGMNSSILQPKNDMGRDGFATTNNPNQYIARDEAGFSLGYFENDYKAINQSNIIQADFFLANPTGSQLQAATKPLYNGNINHMITSIREFMRGDKPNPKPPLAQSYQYDQLNRLITVDNFYDNNLPSSNLWASTGTATNSFKETYKYDPNGNIKELTRYDDTETLMDDFNYDYPLNRNRLNHVKDAVNNSTPATDVESQLDYNYPYDKIGNLIENKQEEIENMVWNVSGKLKQINRKSTSTKDDLEFRYDAMGHRVVKIVKPRPLGNLSNENLWEYTYYIRDANGNIMAVYNKKTTEQGNTYKVQYELAEHSIYGSSRLGVASSPLNTALSSIEFSNAVSFKTDGSYNLTNVAITQSSYSGNPNISYHYLGTKQYELTNHLGSVLATVSDLRTPVLVGTDIVGYQADVKSAQHYYSGGSLMPDNMTYQANKLRYGYQGSEKDDEISGSGNSLDFGARIYDPRIVRIPTIDAHFSRYPSIAPYAYAANNPIYFIDPDGNDVVVAFTGGPTGGGQTIKLQDAGTTGKIVLEAQKNAIAKGVEFDGTVIAPGFTAGSAVSNAYAFIKAKYAEGERLVIYGYSYGGDFAVELAEKLKEDGIQVDLLITVDASDGPLQNSTVNTTIPDNVTQNDNYYQTENSSYSGSSRSTNSSSSGTSGSSSGSSSSNSGSSDSPGSSGGPNSASNSAKTRVNNKNKTGDGVTHGNIDEKIQSNVSRSINNVIGTGTKK